MLKLNTEVHQGILFITLIGDFDEVSFDLFSSEINYLLYQQGFQYFVFDFNNISYLDMNSLRMFQNTLVEIFLTCGRVVMCGLKKQTEKVIGKYRELFFVNNEIEAFQYLNL